MSGDPAGPELSVVVPLYNEAPNVRPLYQAVCAALGESERWELLLVDDGSQDGTAPAAARLAREDTRVRLVRLARNYGQTTAMQAGFDQSRGKVVVSMDGDLQNDPGDIPKLVARLEEGYDLVAGYRVRRKDPLLSRRVPSWAANRLIRWVTGVDIRDNGCSLKAYRGDLLGRLRLYSDMHRFIPAVAVGTAGARITEIPVRHHPRRFGESKYGASRIAKVSADILTIAMIRSFRESPLRLFGYGAVVVMGIAVLFALAAVAAIWWFHPANAQAVVFPGAAMLSVAAALYLLMLGLIAEFLVRRRRDGRFQLTVREWAEQSSSEEGGSR
jgi:glycosyltransferase involved in cell wall biosynthesis